MNLNTDIDFYTELKNRELKRNIQDDKKMAYMGFIAILTVIFITIVPLIIK